MGLLLFHSSTSRRRAFQSGLYYPDGTPKTSLPTVRERPPRRPRGRDRAVHGLELTPKVSVYPRSPRRRRHAAVTVTCDIDCTATPDREAAEDSTTSAPG